MRAGRLRHQVVIQEIVETQDSYGEPAESWDTFVTRRAAIEPLNGREYFASKQENSEVSLRIRMRWDRTANGITTKMRAKFDLHGTSHIYDIEAVINPQMRDQELILMCREPL